MKVYIAGPYSKGDVAQNVRLAIEAADELAAYQFCPYVPHLTHFWHLISPKEYDWWLQYDAMWLLDCAAVLRLPGESNGADEEVKLAEQAGIPVAHCIDDLHRIRTDQLRNQSAYLRDLKRIYREGRTYSCECGRVSATGPIGKQPCCAQIDGCDIPGCDHRRSNRGYDMQQTDGEDGSDG